MSGPRDAERDGPATSPADRPVASGDGPAAQPPPLPTRVPGLARAQAAARPVAEALVQPRPAQTLTAPHGGSDESAAPGAATGAADGAPPAVLLRGAAATVGGRRVWSGVDITLAAGTFTAVLGPNGAGKSTLVKTLLGLTPLAAGSARVLGRPPGGAGAAVGYLPQRRGFDPALRIRGRDIVRLGLDGERWGVPLPLLGRLSARRRAEAARVDEVIAAVNAEPYADRPIGQLSGGEQQRLLIAQALARRPELLLLDEPLDSLDMPTAAGIAALIASVCTRSGVTVVMITHDVNPVLSYLDSVVYVAGGRAVAGSPDQVINDQTLTDLYGTPVEVLRARDGRLVVVGGASEDPHGHPDEGGPLAG